MKKLLIILIAVAACAALAFAQGETKTETPPAPPKTEIVGQIAVRSIPPITVAAILEKAADYAPEGGYKPGMEGASLAWQNMMNKGFEKLGAWIAAGGKPMGPPMGVFYQDPEKTAAKDLTCKLAFPTAPDAKVEAPIALEQWPEMTAVVCTYKGPYEGSAEPWIACDKWVKDNGYEQAGAPMEVYLAGPGDKVPPADYLTEIRIPVKKLEAKPADEGKK